MIARFTIRLLLTFTVISLVPARALEFRVISWDGEISGLHFAQGTKSVEIITDEALFSPTYATNETTPLVLFREVTQDGKIIRVPAASLTPPPDFTRAILVLAAADAARTTFTGVWINDAPEARPPQTITVRNLSTRTVALRFGATERTLPANETFTVPTDPAAQRIPFKMAALTETGWRVVASSSQAVRPGRRTLILLRDGRPQAAGVQDLIDMVTVSDRIPLPPPTSVASR